MGFNIRVLAVIALLVPSVVVGQQLQMTRVRFETQQDLQAIAMRGHAILGIDAEDGVRYVWVVASDVQRSILVSDGHDVSVPPTISAAGTQAINYPDFDTPVTGLHDRLATLAASKGAVTMDTIGFSLEGRPILALKVGPADESAARPNVSFAATTHAREWITPMMTLGLLDYLVDSLPNVPGGQALIDSRDIWVVPVVNPDGYQYTHDVQRLWRKNRRDNGGGTFGVDINRNFPGLWAYNDIGSSAIGASETYRGTSGGSEPETQALIQFHREYPPVIGLSYHSFGNVILYPYSHDWGVLPPDLPVYANLAGSVLAPAIFDRNSNSTRSFYTSGPGWKLYAVNGDYTEWLYRELGTLAFTIELTAGCCDAGIQYGFLFPDDSVQIAQVVSDNLPFALSMIEAAGDPERAIGPSGQMAEGVYFETAAPSVRVVGQSNFLGTTAVVRGVNGQQTVPLRGGELETGTLRQRRSGDVTQVTFPGSVDISPQLRGAVIHYADQGTGGAEWQGWPTDSGGVTGNTSWIGWQDTLVSPEITTWGYERLRLSFWNRHFGSIGRADFRGTVQFSLDSGITWRTADVVVGLGLNWYPVSVPVNQSTPSIRFRMFSDSLLWWVDAIQVLGDAAARDLDVAGPPITARVSENPVRSDGVYISWPPAGDITEVKIFTFRGDLVFKTDVPSAQGAFRWDLRNVNGSPINNGAYIVIIRMGETVLRKRLFVARP